MTRGVAARFDRARHRRGHARSCRRHPRLALPTRQTACVSPSSRIANQANQALASPRAAPAATTGKTTVRRLRALGIDRSTIEVRRCGFGSPHDAGARQRRLTVIHEIGKDLLDPIQSWFAESSFVCELSFRHHVGKLCRQFVAAHRPMIPNAGTCYQTRPHDTGAAVVKIVRDICNKRNFNLIRANSTKRAYLLSCSWSGVVDRDFRRGKSGETGASTPAYDNVGPHDRGRPVHPDAYGLRARPDRAGGGRARSYQIDTGSPAGERADANPDRTRLPIEAERSRRHLGRCRRWRGEELPDRPPHGRRLEIVTRLPSGGRRIHLPHPSASS